MIFVIVGIIAFILSFILYTFAIKKDYDFTVKIFSIFFVFASAMMMAGGREVHIEKEYAKRILLNQQQPLVAQYQDNEDGTREIIYIRNTKRDND